MARVARRDRVEERAGWTETLVVSNNNRTFLVSCSSAFESDTSMSRQTRCWLARHVGGWGKCPAGIWHSLINSRIPFTDHLSSPRLATRTPTPPSHLSPARDDNSPTTPRPSASAYAYAHDDPPTTPRSAHSDMPPGSARSVRSVPLESELGYFPRHREAAKPKPPPRKQALADDGTGDKTKSAGLTRKKSAQLLNGLGKGLGRMGSVMRRGTGGPATATTTATSSTATATATSEPDLSADAPATSAHTHTPVRRKGSVRQAMTQGSWRGRKPPAGLDTTAEEEEEIETPREPLTATSSRPSARKEGSVHTGRTGWSERDVGYNYQGEREGDGEIGLPFATQVSRVMASAAGRNTLPTV